MTDNPPMVLDATCSYSKVWPKYATFRIDIRPEVRPDIVMDNTDLKFPDGFFDEIYYDPPHLVRGTSKPTKHEFWRRFGSWVTKADFLRNIEGVNREFARCLKPEGRLFCKMCEEPGERARTVTMAEFKAKLSNFELISEKTTKSRSNISKAVTYWLVMRRGGRTK